MTASTIEQNGRPRTMWGRFKEVLEHGGPGYVQFAITNICNARCDFCGFAVDKFAPDKRRSVTLQEGRDAIEICARNGIGYLLFVGGEPLVHRHLMDFVRHSAQLGIRPMICTNGSLWTEERLQEAAQAGLSSVIMSIDVANALRHEQHRGLPDVCARIRKANAFFRERGIQSTASVTASRLVEDYEALPAFLEELGFQSCTFSYPLTHLESSYLSFSNSGLVHYRVEELFELYESIIRLKQGTRYPILNPNESLREMQRFLRKKPQKFGCLGGHKYFYLDWNLDLYRCHFWEQPMCSIYEFERGKQIRDGCTRCMIDCYRDPSVLQFVAVNLSDAYHDLRQGNLRGVLGHLCDSRNFDSLRAVWESRRWIGGI